MSTSFKGRATGPQPAVIMLVAETFGDNEAAAGVPLVGPSGKLIDQLLASVNIKREDLRVTNVVNRQPPGNKLEGPSHAWWTDKKQKAAQFGCTHYSDGQWFNDIVREGLDDLAADIAATRPAVIIACGNLALWALTRQVGIGNWRGSELWYRGPIERPKAGLVEATGAETDIAVVPIYHPAYILRKWEEYGVTKHDLRRRVASRVPGNLITPGTAAPHLWAEPKYEFVHMPTFEQAYKNLDNLLAAGGPVACDVETRKGRLACVGFGLSRTQAFCVPLMHVDGRRYWSPLQQDDLCNAVVRVLDSPRIQLIGQNFNYDRQYLYADNCIGLAPRVWHDTMVAQHLLFPGTPKDLSHLSSIYCFHHRYWKDEGKEVDDTVDEERWWYYNCIDNVKTFEVAMGQRQVLERRGFL